MINNKASKEQIMDFVEWLVLNEWDLCTFMKKYQVDKYSGWLVIKPEFRGDLVDYYIDGENGNFTHERFPLEEKYYNSKE